MACRRERGKKAHLFSRTGKEWTASFSAVCADLGALAVSRAWIDGEIVVAEPGGKTSFQALQNALSSDAIAEFTCFAFDLTYLDGYDLRGAALTERKRLLREIVWGASAASAWGRR